MNPNPPIERHAIRMFINNQRILLEEAQAKGTLARTKLDLRDLAENTFSNIPPEFHDKFGRIFDEELEAFCSDMRLASVTVQTQVERKIVNNKKSKSPKKTEWLGIIVILSVIIGTALLFLAVMPATSTNNSAGKISTSPGNWK